MPDLPRGSVHYLRVFQLDHKTYSTWRKTYRHSGPAVSIVQEEGVKRILSEVPVESDGSVNFKEPYLTLVGAAGWNNPVASRNSPGYGIAGAIPVESMDLTMNDPRALATLRPMRYLSRASKLIEIARSGRHHEVKVDPLSLRRLIAWVDACCPFQGEEEIRALDDPDFEGIALLPIRPRVKTAPQIERP